MTQRGTPSAIEALLPLLEEAFDRRSFHGPNLRASLRGLDTARAAYRPAPGRHNIWEEILHTAYWKYVVRRRLTGGKRGSFALDGSNWFPREGAGGEAALKKDILLLVAEHRRLLEVVREMKHVTPEALRLIRGIAAHDIYHAGQIQLLKRLAS